MQNNDHPIQGLMKTAMENIKDMINVNTVVGDPIQTPDGSVIIPVSKVGFGFAAGGSEFNKEKEQSKLPFGGGSGGGVSIAPMGFIVLNRNEVKFLTIEGNNQIYDKIFDLVPKVLDRFTKSNETSKELLEKKDLI